MELSRNLLSAGIIACTSLTAVEAEAKEKKPNIIVIMGDDIGYWNLSVYNRGVMGYRTPNIDKIAKEGALFSDHYAQPSSTAGRAAMITGQMPIRTGLTTVGYVGAKQGLQFKDATLAEVLKTEGYACGQFGKNHLGDRNEYLPTVHGFDEFFGNLYHLNTEEEPEDEDYPKDPAFHEKFGPRGVLHCWATDKFDNTEDPRFGIVGKQRIKDTGPLTRERMKNVDEEFIQAGLDFIEKAVKEDKPFFTWINSSRMHVFTHVPERYQDSIKNETSWYDMYGAGMLQHDEHVGFILDKIKELGVDDNTIIVYTTDNGPEHSTYPHGGTSPFRSEKMTTWEGGVRVPMLVRWKGHINPGTELNGIQSHEDIFTTLTAAAGVTDIRERLAKGDKLGTDIVKKGYIDGINNLDYWTGKQDSSNRNCHIYYSESKLQAIRINQWKLHFSARDGYYGTTTHFELPRIYNLRQDPFESYSEKGYMAEIFQRKTYLFNSALSYLNEHIQSLKLFPPSQKPNTLNVNEMIQKTLKD
ncbi:MAG: arylsulfatase [Bacteroidales bacterium]